MRKTANTLKPFVQSPNDRDPSNFDWRGLEKGINVLDILIYLLIRLIKLEKKIVKSMF